MADRLDSPDGTNASQLELAVTGDVTGCTFRVFINDVQEGADITPTIEGSKASATWPLRKVADTEEKYVLKWSVIKGGTPSPQDEYTIYPNPLHLTSKKADDAPYPRVPFVVKVSDREIKYPTDDSGVAALCLLDRAGPQTVTLEPGWDWVDGSAAAGQKTRKRTYQVKNIKTAVFVGPTSTTKIEQLVNVPTTAEGRDGKGHTIKVQVKIKDGHGKTNEEIFVQAKFGFESKRNGNPTPGLADVDGLTKEDSDKLQKGKVKLSGNDATCTFTLVLGHGGGDTCELKIGTTEERKDAKLEFETYREIEYETWQPQNSGAASGVLSAWTVGGTAGTAGIPTNAKDHLEGKLKDVKIKAKYAAKGYFTREQLAAESWIPVSGTTKLIPTFDGAFFNETGKVCVLTFDQIFPLLDTTLSPAANPRRVQILYTDYIADFVVWTQRFDNVPAAGANKVPNQNLLPWCIIKGKWLSGTLEPIVEYKWRLKVKTGGTWTTDPDGWGWVALSAAADVRKHAKVNKINQVQFMFPNDTSNANYPGQYGAQKMSGGAQEVKYDVSVTGGGWTWGNINGCAVGGVVAMNKYSPSIGAVHPIGIHNVVIHEIGHNMGQTYASNTVDATFGRPNTGEIPGLPFPTPVASGGNVYGGHGHTGTHCAMGLTASQKASADYGPLSGTCVMFGSDNMMASAPKEFCAECKPYVKAEDLTSIRKSWTT